MRLLQLGQIYRFVVVVVIVENCLISGMPKNF